ncbi:hypothetical protein [Streptomyces adelaidensis]|jgi:hypothetical protein|uniref:hypothetical protein n=1 Tax=Streptomyces adelaidensis TaxID=2796465 RepID=UPI001902C701|nr:hypothetical protein [Streptomyces adelaidensis]
MAKSSANGAARTKSPTPTWHELAAETDSKRAHWVRGRNHTEFVACGEGWQAVSVRPIHLGLDALAAMHIGTSRGYLIVADHLRGVLYVMVPPGSDHLFAGIPCVRVLGRGHQLLMPRSVNDTSAAADWIGVPCDLDDPLLVAPDRLAARLQDLAPAYAKAVAS